MSIKNLIMCTLLVASSAQASNVAIIDSGTDMLHTDIAPQAWINENEKADNNRDDDRNGYVDDMQGWNFAESNAMVIDYKYLGTLTADVRRFFETQQRMILGKAATEDIEWMRSMLKDPKFLKQLQVYGNFMHGTHVAGIAAKDAVDAKIMAVKLIPTEVKLPGASSRNESSALNNFFLGMGVELFKRGLGLLAKQQMKMMEEIAVYIDGHKIDVANGSFGTGYNQIKTMVGSLFKGVFKRDMTKEEEKKLIGHFFDVLLEKGKDMASAASNTLFVFAAGNDGSNNDVFPTSPTNIKASNVISVAAAIGNTELASFSNFGVDTVDVAAPGVAIESAVPGNQLLRVSGTSQAAPYVANVAAKVKDANPALKASQVKEIILKTVDIKSWLETKVRTSGVVNMNRAVKAAELSRTESLENAVKRSRRFIADRPSTGVQWDKSGGIQAFIKGMVLPLPSSIRLK